MCVAVAQAGLQGFIVYSISDRFETCACVGAGVPYHSRLPVDSAEHICHHWFCVGMQVWGVGGKFGTSAAVGVVLPPSAQMVEKQGWSYVSRPSQLLRGAHSQQNEITSLSFSQVMMR